MSERKSKFSSLYRLLNRRRIILNLEFFSDTLIVFLCIGLLLEMGRILTEVFLALSQPLDFQEQTSNILFLLILVELFRLLAVYLQEHSISVAVAVEVSIVSVLREIIVHGILHINWQQIFAICAFLLVMGVLLLICSKTPDGHKLIPRKYLLGSKKSAAPQPNTRE